MAESMRQAEEGRKMIDRLLVGPLDQRVGEADRIPALKTAVVHTGLTTSEFVTAFVAYHSAMGHLQGEERNASRPQRAEYFDGQRFHWVDLPAADEATLQPGVFKDNVDLIRPMKKAENLWTYLGS